MIRLATKIYIERTEAVDTVVCEGRDSKGALVTTLALGEAVREDPDATKVEDPGVTEDGENTEDGSGEVKTEGESTGEADG